MCKYWKCALFHVLVKAIPECSGTCNIASLDTIINKFCIEIFLLKLFKLIHFNNEVKFNMDECNKSLYNCVLFRSCIFLFFLWLASTWGDLEHFGRSKFPLYHKTFNMITITVEPRCVELGLVEILDNSNKLQSPLTPYNFNSDDSNSDESKPQVTWGNPSVPSIGLHPDVSEVN